MENEKKKKKKAAASTKLIQSHVWQGLACLSWLKDIFISETCPPSARVCEINCKGFERLSFFWRFVNLVFSTVFFFFFFVVVMSFVLTTSLI